MLTWLSKDSLSFPHLARALREPDGLLAAGGDLRPERILAAYRHGCYPWYQQGQPILWWSPDPRFVLFPDELHISRSLGKVLRRQTFEVSYDKAFDRVIDACAGPRSYADGTWITDAMRQAYLQLHRLGHAHSVEVWQAGELVGGLYGLCIGQVFFGESMFSHVDNASKTAFAHLVPDLKRWGIRLIDCQMQTRHLASFGARAIDRQAFAELLAQLIDQPNSADWIA